MKANMTLGPADKSQPLQGQFFTNGVWRRMFLPLMIAGGLAIVTLVAIGFYRMGALVTETTLVSTQKAISSNLQNLAIKVEGAGNKVAGAITKIPPPPAKLEVRTPVLEKEIATLRKIATVQALSAFEAMEREVEVAPAPPPLKDTSAKARLERFKEYLKKDP